MATHYNLRAVLFNRCGYGRSTCSDYSTGAAEVAAETEPAVQWAHIHGASRVVLFGASVGAGDALEAAGLVPGVTAVVALSDAGNDSGVDENIDARKDQVPTLLAVAPADPVAPVAHIEHLYAEVPAHPKKLIILTSMGGVHGWDLLVPSVAVTVTAWMLKPSN